MARVTIVGAGMMGTATTFALADNGHRVRLVGTHLDTQIIMSCKERDYQPRLKRDLPSGVRSYCAEEVAEALEIMAGETLEGAAIVHVMGKVLPRIIKRGLLNAKDLPLLGTLVDMPVHGKPVKLPLKAFFGGLGRI